MSGLVELARHESKDEVRGQKWVGTVLLIFLDGMKTRNNSCRAQSVARAVIPTR
jgi:hypothetical protein